MLDAYHTSHSSGTKQFQVQISNSPNGPWDTIVQSQLDDPRKYDTRLLNKDDKRHDVPIQEFSVEREEGRYVKFVCDTHWGLVTCALHSIEVVGLGTANFFNNN